MLFLICCGWVASGVLAYWLTRRRHIKRGVSWLNFDAVTHLPTSVLGGPTSLIVELFILASGLDVIEAIHKWFDHPSRW